MAPTQLTHTELLDQFELLRSDPHKFLDLVQQYVAGNPDDQNGYFTRHTVWARLGRNDLALEDLERCLALECHYMTYQARGKVLRAMGRHQEAIADFAMSENLNPEAWLGGFGPLFGAECYARLGNLEAALADCAKLREDHWTPGMFGTPAGSKNEVITEIRRIASALPQGSN